MDFETELRAEFNKLLKAGSKEVYKLIDEVDGYIDETETLTLLEKRMEGIVKQVRADKKLSFTQYKEIYPFILSERKLKLATAEKDEWIILE
jgi:hypothetical protein